MDKEEQTTETKEVVSTVGGVTVIKVTVLDKHRTPVNPQPAGRFQIWQVIGDVRMVAACDSPEEAAKWLARDESNMFYTLSEELIPIDELENALNASTTDDPHSALDCQAELVGITDGEETLLARQLKRQNRKCTISEYPVLLGGFDLTAEPPSHAAQQVPGRPQKKSRP